MGEKDAVRRLVGRRENDALDGVRAAKHAEANCVCPAEWVLRMPVTRRVMRHVDHAVTIGRIRIDASGGARATMLVGDPL